MNAFVIFPDQLFAAKEAVDVILACDSIYIVEDPAFFLEHACLTKLVMLRAACRNYYSWLSDLLNKLTLEDKIKHKPSIFYVKRSQIVAPVNTKETATTKSARAVKLDIFDYLRDVKLQVNMFRAGSIYDWQNKPWDCKYNGLSIKFYESLSYVMTYRETRDLKSDYMYDKNHFYRKIMERLNVPPEIMSAELKSITVGPINLYMLWENRILSTPEIKQAKQYIAANFSNATKQLSVSRLPVTHGEAEALLKTFLEAHLSKYQHMQALCIYPPLQLGLLTPYYVIATAVKYGMANKVEPQYIKQFIHDILHREYARMIYIKSSVASNISILAGSLVALKTTNTTDTIDRIISGKLRSYEDIIALMNYMNAECQNVKKSLTGVTVSNYIYSICCLSPLFYSCCCF